MKKILKFFILLFFIFGGLFLFSNVSFAAVPTPQIYKIVPSPDNPLRPWVIGLTPNEVAVEVLVDGKPMGFAKVVKDKSGTASFGWAPQKDLTSGFHKFSIRGKFGEEYSTSGAILGYKIPTPSPAPTLVKPQQFNDYVLIRGLIKNDSSVKIYIDNVLRADFKVPNHPSGVTNFWFKAGNLKIGKHTVYAVAYDKNKILSKHSNNEIFTVIQSNEVADFKEAQNKEQKVKIIDNKEKINIKVKAEVDDKKTTNQKQADNQEANKLKGEVKDVNNKQQDEKVNNDENKTGEISSAEEIKVENKEDNKYSVEKRNRIAGIVLLIFIIIALIIWYARERKRENNNKDEENIDE